MPNDIFIMSVLKNKETNKKQKTQRAFEFFLAEGNTNFGVILS